MRALKMSEIAKALAVNIDTNITVDSVCTDSRNIKKGCLFIAIRGENFDGNDFVGEALDKGAAFAVCDREIRGLEDKTIVVPDSRKALADIAAYYRKKFNIHVVGITGSVGKTTTKEMVYQVLSCKYKTVKTLGNKNNEIGLPQMIFTIEEDTRAAVFEMGMSALGEISRLSRVALPTLGIITNIGVSHIEHLGSRENILKAKLEILDGMKCDAPLLLNGDDDMLLMAAGELDRPVVLYSVKKQGCHFKAQNIEQQEDKTLFEIVHFSSKTKVCIPAFGMHNVLNATAAFAAGVTLGVEPDVAAGALSNYRPEGMRQKIVTKGGITVIEDCYNASPDSMKAAFDILKNINKRKIAVLGDMLELGDISEKAHYEAGRLAALNKTDILFAYGDMAQHYVKGAREAGLENCHHYTDKVKLADTLLNVVEKGDVVFFKASRGMKLEEVIALLYEGLKD